METLANLESFVRSAEAGSFSAAARRLSLTPAAVSRNVATLERNLGLRLFHRSTRRLTLTEAGERFLLSIGGNLDALQAAITEAATARGEVTGVLKVSLSVAFGVRHILPLLPEFLARHPRIRPDWRFENRQVDLIAEGLDAAIGGAFELSPGLTSRVLAPAHLVVVAAPAYLAGRALPTEPADLSSVDGIVMRSGRTGRVRPWLLRDATGTVAAAAPLERIVVNDPLALVEGALLGLGAALVVLPDALPHLESGRLVRLVPGWHADAGGIQLYYASRSLMPGKTRAFIDFVVEAFRRDGLAERFAADATGGRS